MSMCDNLLFFNIPESKDENITEIIHELLKSKPEMEGTKIGVSEQFPEEIECIRKTLYSELKKAKAEGKKAVMVRDKLYIEDRLFHHAGNSARS